MARYHYLSRRAAERQYQHRADIQVPEGGLGGRLNEMLDWCRERFTDWTQAGVTDKDRRDARGILIDVARFYFIDKQATREFRERWGGE